MLSFNLKIIWQVSYLLLFHKCEKWDKEMLKCLLNFIWLARERRSQKILTPKLMMSEKLSGKNIKPTLKCPCNTNTCQCLTSVKISGSTTPKANLFSHITRASCFAVSFSLSPNTTFVSTPNLDHYLMTQVEEENPLPWKSAQVAICQLSALLSEPSKKEMFISMTLLESQSLSFKV